MEMSQIRVNTPFVIHFFHGFIKKKLFGVISSIELNARGMNHLFAGKFIKIQTNLGRAQRNPFFSVHHHSQFNSISFFFLIERNGRKSFLKLVEIRIEFWKIYCSCVDVQIGILLNLWGHLKKKMVLFIFKIPKTLH